MHPLEPQELDFTLDDIIREFSEQEPDDALPAPSPLVTTEDTVRLENVEPISQAMPVTRETTVFQPVQNFSQQCSQILNSFLSSQMFTNHI